MEKHLLAAVTAIFIFGCLCGSFYSEIASPAYAASGADVENPAFVPNQDVPSPHDWVSEDQIKINKDSVVINIANPTWAKFAPTRSMDPVFDEGAHAIQIVPKSKDDVHEGDVISYEVPYMEGLVIHRVIRIGNDESGWYAITKGDNNAVSDPDKVRFNHIKKVLVAVIY